MFSFVVRPALLGKIAKLSVENRRIFHNTKVCCLFWERSPKSGYGGDKKPQSHNEQIREGLKELKGEIKLWTEEMKDKFQNDPILVFRPGETDVIWKFGTPEALNQWNCTTDKDNNEGFSSASLELNKYGKGVFSGELHTRVPKDGRVKRAGYCNITTTRARRSFKREIYLDWTSYNMLVLKVRGDGRTYMLNIATKGYFDIMWNDMYHYVLYTRGGPYWQTTRIPFSKFFFSSKGRIQDKQFPLPLNRITNFGISAVDKVDGPFNLEIDYIGLEDDPDHTEEFAYEMYETGDYIAGT